MTCRRTLRAAPALLLFAPTLFACSSSSKGAVGPGDAMADHAAAVDAPEAREGAAREGGAVDGGVDAHPVDAPDHDDATDATKPPEASIDASDGGIPPATEGGTDAPQETGTKDAHVAADTGVDAGPPALRYIGRTLTDGTSPDGTSNCTATNPCFEWSGTQVVARFTGATGFTISMSDYGNSFDVYVDGMLQGTTVVGASGTTDYLLASGLTASATHEVSLYKRTEASSFNRTQILGYSFTGSGTLLPPAAPQTRRIEVIGDSISCGFGILGTNGSCDADATNEDHDDTYGAVTARALEADLYTIASSGRGVYVNIDGSKTGTLPDIYGETLPYVNAGVTPSSWNFASWTPDVVVIDLGSNDFLANDSDPGSVFGSTYLTFVKRIRTNYPNAWIFCTNGPLLTDPLYSEAQTYIQGVVTSMNDPKVKYLAFPTQSQDAADQGCDGHPNVATDQSMATLLTSTISSALGW